MSVSTISKKTGISVRTLHYYDQIGLLKPSSITEAGYRLYDESSLSLIQQILFFRELEFSLSSIKNILLNPEYDKHKILKQQRHLLVLKKSHLDDLLVVLDQTLEQEEVNKMSICLKDISNIKKEYAKEIKKLWDLPKNNNSTDTNANTTSKLTEKSGCIFCLFAKYKHKNPSSKEVQNLVQVWKDYITKSHFVCTTQNLRFLGKMYINDMNFKKSLDDFGEGTAKFMSDAINIYCDNIERKKELELKLKTENIN